MMKVKLRAKTTIGDYITEGNVYEAEVDGELGFRFQYDNGNKGVAHKKHFTIIDEPKIEVGSEWVSLGMECEVKYIGEHKVFIRWNNDGSEGSRYISAFLKDFTPKPKTVTMYFYKDRQGLIHSCSEPLSFLGCCLFTREIELP